MSQTSLSSSVPTAPSRGKSIASLVLGIVSVLCGYVFVLPIIGLVLGVVGRRSEPAGRTPATVGIVLNALCLFGWVIALVLIVAVFGVTAVTAPFATS